MGFGVEYQGLSRVVILDSTLFPTHNPAAMLSGLALKFILNLTTSHNLHSYHPGPCHRDIYVSYYNTS